MFNIYPLFVFSVNEKDWYNILQERVSPLVSTAQVSILKLALSMRVYSPRIEMYSQMAHERGVGNSKCPNAAADVGGKLVCNHRELEAMVIYKIIILLFSK
jgi:UDP-glucose:glycoprotein glucosyltransferase